MKVNPFRFNLHELGGAFGDLGTLLPLMIAMVLLNGLNITLVLLGVGLFYIVSGLYFRIPTPVQPLKAVAAIAISLGLSGSVIGAAGFLMGIILLVLSLTNAISFIVKLFPRAVVRGIQLSIGLILARKGLELILQKQAFISGASRPLGIDQFQLGIILAAAALLIFVLVKYVLPKLRLRFSPPLAMLTFGLSAGVIFNPISGFNNFGPVFLSISLPSANDFWLAFTILVIPQLPLTLGNAVVGTWDTAKTYFNDQAHRVTPRALTASMGLANVTAGLMGAMPMCHGSGGLTAHYKLGARTGASNIMIGSLLVILGISLGYAAISFLSLIPLPVLGILLAIVGVYHAFLIRDLAYRSQLAVAGIVAVATIAFGSIAYGFGAGILLHHILRLMSSRSAQQINRIPTQMSRREHSEFDPSYQKRNEVHF